eukprot:TRINITY_DN4921_c0_g1_i2.p1 TRINITY_DN4921_c0_g1~~TRINITY_DN4921_c0_g1_i2.p1  ORF type:complete len:694 (-),score=127.78 TRINITY_DN4921_c0_g1_i2:30-2111(-)
MQASSADMTHEQQALIAEEDKYRRLFAEDRNSQDLDDPHLMLTEVFGQSSASWDYQPESAAEQRVPKLLTTHQGPLQTGRAITDTLDQFKQNWNNFSQNMFAGLDFSNVFIAGGSVLAALTNKQGGDTYGKSDIDVFIYGITDDAAANAKLKHIHDVIQRTSSQCAVIRTKRTVTFINSYPYRHVQVILKLYKSPAEVLLGFDVDCCTFGFDGEKVWSMERGHRAVVKRYNLANETRRSTTYEGRLYKYSKRGFAVAVPNFDKTTINAGIYTMRTWQANGLAKLVLFDHNQQLGIEEEYSEDSDYSPDLEIPWGPGWTTQAIVNKLNAKDKSQFYAAKFRAAHEGSDPSPSGSAHKHLFVPGLDDMIKGDFWCDECKATQQLPDESDEDFVPRRIVWLKEAPAYQDIDKGFTRKLMTGSFKVPLDTNWRELALNGPPDTFVPARPRRIKASKRALKAAPSKNSRSVLFGGPQTTTVQATNALPVTATPHMREAGHFPFGPATTVGISTTPGPKTPVRAAQRAVASAIPANSPLRIYGTTAIAPASPARSYLAEIGDGFASDVHAFGIQPGGPASPFTPATIDPLGLISSALNLTPTTTTTLAGLTTTTSNTQGTGAVVVASDRQYGDLTPPSRALYLISLAYKQGDISMSEREKLKELFIQGSEIISAAVEVFDIDRDMLELVDTFKRLSFNA